jgi:nucleoside-diphosphate-sugar epimerase
VIPTIITQALAGTEVRLGSLTPTRDFNFVADIVEGFIAAASSEQAGGEVINLGSGAEVSVQKLASTIGELLGKKLTLIAEDQRIRPENSEVERLCADATKARELLGWEPRISLDEGLRQTLSWIEHNLQGYRVDTYAI